MVIKHHDDSLVAISENTKELVILKSTDAFDSNSQNKTEEYYKFDLRENGTIAVEIPTSNRDQSSILLEV